MPLAPGVDIEACPKHGRITAPLLVGQHPSLPDARAPMPLAPGVELGRAGIGLAQGGSFVPQVLAVVRAVTGSVDIQASDRIGDAGVDSINMMQLLPRLKALSSSNGVEGSEAITSMFLVSNPTVQDISDRLVAAAEPGDATLEGGARPKRMNLEACFGLRTIFCLWIVRGHMRGICNDKDSDVRHYDQHHFWRTVVFMLLSGMTMSMQFDKAAPTTKRLVWQLAPPLFPAFWFASAVQWPIMFLTCWTDLNHVGIIICCILNLLLFQSWGPMYYYQAMGHCWYLTVQLTFYLCFNWMMRSIKRRAMKTLDDFFRRLRAVFFTFLAVRLSFLWSNLLLHFFVLFRLPDFKIGMLVGQAVLHVDLSEKQEKLVCRATDAAVFFMFLFAFVDSMEVSVAWAVIMWFCGEFILASILFGLCRTDCFAAKILSHPFIADFGQYSYCVYLIHYPLLQWSRYAWDYGLDTWKQVFEADYVAMECVQEDDKCDAPQWRYVGDFTTIIFAAVVMTKLVHQPFQRYWNKRIGKVTEWVTFEKAPTEDELAGELADCCTCCAGDGCDAGGGGQDDQCCGEGCCCSKTRGLRHEFRSPAGCCTCRGCCMCIGWK